MDNFLSIAYDLCRDVLLNDLSILTFQGCIFLGIILAIIEATYQSGKLNLEKVSNLLANLVLDIIIVRLLLSVDPHILFLVRLLVSLEALFSEFLLWFLHQSAASMSDHSSNMLVSVEI